MSLWERWFHKHHASLPQNERPTPTVPPTASVVHDTGIEMWTETFTPQERDLVAVLATAAVNGDHAPSHWQITRIQKQEMNKMVALLAASAVMSGESPQTRLVVKRIQRLS